MKVTNRPTILYYNIQYNDIQYCEKQRFASLSLLFYDDFLRCKICY